MSSTPTQNDAYVSYLVLSRWQNSGATFTEDRWAWSCSAVVLGLSFDTKTSLGRFGGFTTTKPVESDDPSRAGSLLFVARSPLLGDVTFTEAVGSKADSEGVAVVIAAGTLGGRCVGGRRGVAAAFETVAFDAPTL